MEFQLAQSIPEFLSAMLFIVGFMALLGIMTVFMFLLITQPIWSKKLAESWKQGERGMKLIKSVFG